MLFLLNRQFQRDRVSLPYGKTKLSTGKGMFTLLCQGQALLISYQGDENFEGVLIQLLDQDKRCVTEGYYTKGQARLVAPTHKDGYIFHIKSNSSNWRILTLKSIDIIICLCDTVFVRLNKRQEKEEKKMNIRELNKAIGIVVEVYSERGAEIGKSDGHNLAQSVTSLEVSPKLENLYKRGMESAEAHSIHSPVSIMLKDACLSAYAVAYVQAFLLGLRDEWGELDEVEFLEHDVLIS